MSKLSPEEREEMIVALSLRKNYSLDFLAGQPDHVLEAMMKDTEETA